MNLFVAQIGKFDAVFCWRDVPQVAVPHVLEFCHHFYELFAVAIELFEGSDVFSPIMLRWIIILLSCVNVVYLVCLIGYGDLSNVAGFFFCGY